MTGPPAPVAVWLTGLPCSGKTTIAGLVAAAVRARGRRARVLDGDVLRRSLSADLGFSPEDRCEQARRVAVMAAVAIAEEGAIAVVALVSPLERARAAAREVLGAAYVEVHVDAPLTVCEARDVKGMFRLARAGRIAQFTGVSAPFEAPAHPALRLHTAVEDPQTSARRVIDLLVARGALGG